MTEALSQIIKFSFNELCLHRLEANVDPNNSNSLKLLMKLNFKKEAFLREDYFINGKFTNSIILSKLANE
jgi:[ribosomal protein S5]-alanine N-acetyltransferase